MSSLATDLWHFICARSAQHGNYNIISLQSGRAGKFLFERDDLEEFWQRYCQVLSTDEDFCFGLAEKYQNVQPVRADIDLETKLTSHHSPKPKDVASLSPRQANSIKKDDKVTPRFSPLYTQEQLQIVVKVYQRVLLSLIAHVTLTGEAKRRIRSRDVVCLVLEKAQPYVSGDRLKGGFHLHFPYIWLKQSDHDVHVLPKVRKMLNEQYPTLFKETLGVDLSGSLIDEDISKKNWLIYGSGKSPEAGSYRYTQAIDKDGQKIPLLDALKPFKLLDLSHNQIILDTDVKCRYWLPRILSTDPETKTQADLKTGLACELAPSFMRRLQPFRAPAEQPLEELIVEAESLVPLLSPERATDYKTWFNVIWCLFTIGNGSEQALALAKRFSETTTANNYNETDLVYRWQNLSAANYLTIRSIHCWAEEDNPTEYRKFKHGRAEKYIDEALNGGHTLIAKMLFEYYKTESVLADIKNNEWWIFQDGRWFIDEKGLCLRKKITDVIEPKFQAEKDRVLDEQRAAERRNDSEAAAALKEKAKKLRAMTRSLNTDSFKKSILSQCSELFRQPKFFEWLDASVYLVGFDNGGVWDCSEYRFRSGRPGDYISRSVGYCFKEYRMDDEEVLEVKDFIRKMFPDHELEEFFWDYAAGILKGGNSRKQFVNLSGKGDNAKTTLIIFLEFVFGTAKNGYMAKLPTTLITGKNQQSNSATPEVARLQGIRFGVMDEPSKKERINVSAFKRLTGNDTQYTRRLFHDPVDIKPQFKLCLVCLAGDTYIALPHGLCAPIRSLENGTSVLSHDEQVKGLVPASQTKWIKQGVKQCVKLTFSDGRNITATPDHRFLTEEGWVEAQHIKLNEQAVIMGPDFARCEDLMYESDYVLELGKTRYRMDVWQERAKAMAFCRLVGYMLTDGSRNEHLYVGHTLDVRTILDDIELITGHRASPCRDSRSNTHTIALPMSLRGQLGAIMPVQKGGRVNNPMVLPAFLFDSDVPDFLVRECLGGMFGGDGCVPSLSRKKQGTIRFSSLSIVASKSSEHIPSLISSWTQLGIVMNQRFKIKTKIKKPVKNEATGNYSIHLVLRGLPDIFRFAENVGFRHCCHKSYRLTAVASYVRYKKSYGRQNKVIIQRGRELLNAWRKQRRPEIEQIDLDGKIVKRYGDRNEAANATGTHKDAIWRVCHEKAQTAGGWKWRLLCPVESVLRSRRCEEAYKEAYEYAVKELEAKYGGLDPESFYDFKRARNYLRDSQLVPKAPWCDIEAFLKRHDFIKYFNEPGKNEVVYAVPADASTLPTHRMFVTGRICVGEKFTYDLSVEEQYANFLAEGAVAHNCNELPKFEDVDDAGWNRQLVLPCESTFPKPESKIKVPETTEEQFRLKIFPRDEEFSEKLPNLAPAFMWLLTERYKQFQFRAPVAPPEKVLLATAQYRERCDVYLKYWNEQIISGERAGEDAQLSLAACWADFKVWYPGVYGREQLMPTRDDLMAYLEKQCGPIDNNGFWKGWRLRDYRDEEANGNLLLVDPQPVQPAQPRAVFTNFDDIY